MVHNVHNVPGEPVVLAEGFIGLRPHRWDRVDHLQPRSDGFEAALDLAAAELDRLRTEGHLTPDTDPSGTALWVDDTDDGRPHRTSGIVVAVRADGRGGDAVLPHERTFPEPVGRRVRTRNRLLVEPTPTMLLLRDQVPALSALLEDAQRGIPVLSHGDDGAEHHATPVATPPELLEALRGIPALVCDGHHRIAAGRSPGAADCGRILAWLVAAESPPRLHPVHRTIRRLPAETLGLLERAGIDREAAAPHPVRDAPVLVTGLGAWLLSARPGARAAGILAQLPPSVRELPATLVSVVLHEILGIGTRRDQMGTTIDAAEAVRAVGDGADDGAVLSCGPTIEQVWHAAEHGVLLPAKATWFAPKPLAGAVLRPLPPLPPLPG